MNEGDYDPEALNSIQRFIERKHDQFGLLFVVCNDVMTRAEELDNLRITVTVSQIVVDLAPGIMDPLEVIVLDPKLSSSAMHVIGLEKSVSSDETNLGPLHALNLRRGQWERLNCPIIFWIPEYLLGMMLRHAPDFSSWRSGNPRVMRKSHSTEDRSVFLSYLESFNERELYRLPFSDQNARRNRILELENRLEGLADRDSASIFSWQRELALLYACENKLDKVCAISDLFFSSIPRDQAFTKLNFIGLLMDAFKKVWAYDSIFVIWGKYGKYLDDAEIDGGAQIAPEVGRIFIKVGSFFWSAGDLDNAVIMYDRASKVYEKLGDLVGQARVVGSVANVMAESGESQRALELYQRSLVLFQSVGASFEIAASFCNIGAMYSDLGYGRKASEFYENSLEIFRQIGDRKNEGRVLGNLATAYSILGDNHRAIEYFNKNLDISKEIGDRVAEGRVLGNLGIAYSALGDIDKALEFYEQDLVLARQLGDLRGEAATLGNMGNAYNALGNFGKAIECHKKDLDIARKIGGRREEGIALGNLGTAYGSLGDAETAMRYYELHLELAPEVGDRRSHANTLWNSANALRLLDDVDLAIARGEEAVEMFETIESPNIDKCRNILDLWKQEKLGS